MLLSIGIFILLLVLLTIAVKQNNTSTFDTKILDFFNSIESTALDTFFNAITWLGSLWVLAPAMIGITLGLIFYGYRIPALAFNLGFVSAVATTYAMKFAFDRGRPELFEVIGDMPPDPSYPSAHTTQAFAFALMLGVLAYMLDSSSKLTLSILFLSFALVVATSRVYLQVHFPSDVLAGVLVASIWAGIIVYFIKLGVFR